jgi:hypothetical protein
VRAERQVEPPRPARPRRRRWPRRLAIALAALLALGVALHFALDPIVTWRTRLVLNGLEGYRGRFNDVHVSLKDLSYRIDDLRLEKLSAGGKALPFFEVRRAEVGLYWKELLHGHVVGGMKFQRPKLNLIAAKEKKDQQGDAAQEAGHQLTKLAPIRVDRFEVQDGEVLFLDRTSERSARLWLHGIEATLENFATRPALARGEPTVLALRGTLQRTGKVSVFATSDPLAKKVTFAGQAELTGLHFAELGEIIAAKAGIAPTKGILDMRARFVAHDGAITGGVRPILKDASVEAADSGLGAKLKALVADASLKIFSDDIEGRKAVATTIPIKGNVDAPQVQAVPTILGIVRNAFVAGVSGSMQNLPPPTAKKKQGTLEQARRALSSDRGPPRAQPTTEAHGDGS